MKSSTILIGLLASALPATALKLWQQAADLPNTIPVSCRAGLTTNITCAPNFVSVANVLGGLPYDDNFLGQYCTSGCYSSLKSFRSTVAARCRGQTYTFAPGVNQTGEAIADALLWAYNVTCVKDSSDFCIPRINNGTVQPCESCLLGYQAAALQLPTYGQRVVDRNAFSSTLSSCSVPSGSYTIPPATSTTSTSSEPTSTNFCSGSTYTAQNGDTCKSVAQANSVGQDNFITQNLLAYNCDTIPAGTKLCIGDSCDLHEVAANETCKDVIAGLNRVTTFELTNWNPTIHSSCDNLPSMQGRLICVSPPGGKWTPDDNSIPGVNNGASTSSGFSFTPFIQTTNMVPVKATPSAPTNFTVPTWGIPEPVTRTRTWNATAASALAIREQYCPDFSNTTVINVEGLPQDCQDLWDPYCFPNPDDPILPSPTSVPSSCQPAYYASTTDDGSDSTASATSGTAGSAGSVARIAAQTTSSSASGTSKSSTSSTGAETIASNTKPISEVSETASDKTSTASGTSASNSSTAQVSTGSSQTSLGESSAVMAPSATTSK